jgi:NAD-dependent deacetylase
MDQITFSQRLVERIRNASNVVVLTGAGMSAASGVPTFRGKDGLWNKFNPQELANVDAFLKNPKLVWEWYNWRRDLIRNVKPNLGHYALVDVETYFPYFAIVTQNVDNLHQLAGSKRVLELHGNVTRNKCIECSRPYENEHIDLNSIPHCPKCGGLIRPDVVWFGELLPEKVIREAQELSAAAEIFFSVGTSSTVEPAASLPYLAKGNGAYLVEINPERTPLSDIAEESIQIGADIYLPRLVIELDRIRRR